MSAPCIVEGCEKPSRARGLCGTHHMREHRARVKAGLPKPDRMYKRTPLADRFWPRVNKTPGGCWLWTGGVATSGYGVVPNEPDAERRMEYAHRVSYVLTHGEIPAGSFIRHTCDTPLCVNPDHLIAGTHQDNMRDMVERKRQTHGEKNPHAQLTADDVRQIRASTEPSRDLATKHGVGADHIRAIRRGVFWKEPEYEAS